MKKIYTKIIKYLILLVITLLISSALTYSAKSINDESIYVAPSQKTFIIQDDTGYTEHNSGWPTRFYSYRTFRSVGTLVTTEAKINWENFVLNTIIFAAPLSLIIIIIIAKKRINP